MIEIDVFPLTCGLHYGIIFGLILKNPLINCSFSVFWWRRALICNGGGLKIDKKKALILLSSVVVAAVIGGMVLNAIQLLQRLVQRLITEMCKAGLAGKA
jgi:hypothetical protein